ncbi:hypothetical protein GNVKYODX_CDS94 [Acinetobacter phage vB_AbaM_AB3P2]|nr:hypothetical protein GNVKYODX_CDS94 [Acinetobacter phage vB_AbaM_AB3P2]
MKLAMLVYFASLSHGLCVFLFFLGIILTIVGAAATINRSITNDVYDGYADYEIEKKQRADSAFNSTKKFLLIGPVVVALSILIPSEKTIYIMAGAYATEQIASNERVQKIGSDVLQVIEGKLEKLKQEK